MPVTAESSGAEALKIETLDIISSLTLYYTQWNQLKKRKEDISFL